MASLATTVVVPTVGRPSLATLLEALAAADGPRPEAVVVVDDRPGGKPLDLSAHRDRLLGLLVVRSWGVGPAGARNVGWRHARTPWVSFLDDDVVPDPDWYGRLHADIAAAGDRVAGTQGRVRVPLPANRRPTDWERATAGLASARWITADMTYRRDALRAVGGFDERFPRAYREDADLGLRVLAAGGQLVTGSRRISHPVRPSDDYVSLRQQAGNADDVLMRRRHGRHWRERAGAASGRRRRHVAITVAAGTALAAAATGRHRVTLAATAGWVSGVAEFAATRLLPGPRDPAEVRRMLLTSLAIPPAATWHTARGLWRHRSARPWHGPPELVLFDRDGTVVDDVPYNADPGLVEPVPGAREALCRLRAAGVRTGVVTNQSGVASGRVTAAQLAAVNHRVEQLLGPFDIWLVCPHGRDEGCDCRKPAPGLVKDACSRMDVPPERCAVIGDIGSDVEAAEAAGATGVLVPTPDTRATEVSAAQHVFADLGSAVGWLLDGAA